MFWKTIHFNEKYYFVNDLQCLFMALRKIVETSFSQKLVFSLFKMKLGKSGDVRGEGADHTKTLSRTLAGFGLTWHRKVNFSTFDGKLEGSFMTKYLQIGFWISPKARGFWLNGLRRKFILKNDPKKQICCGKLGSGVLGTNNVPKIHENIAHTQKNKKLDNQKRCKYENPKTQVH